jgi:hypothetical protein
VAGVDARADLDGPFLDRLLDLRQAAVGLVVGPVVVDRDLDPYSLVSEARLSKLSAEGLAL